MIRYYLLLIFVLAIFSEMSLTTWPAEGACQALPDSLAYPDNATVLSNPERGGGGPDSLDISGRSRLLLFPSSLDNINTNLIFSARKERSADKLMGYEIYRATRMQCTIEGAGAGASLGLMVGAFGEMMSAWDEKTSWYIGGAMAAFGAYYGGKIKADDDGFSLRIRWDEGGSKNSGGSGP